MLIFIIVLVLQQEIILCKNSFSHRIVASAGEVSERNFPVLYIFFIKRYRLRDRNFIMQHVINAILIAILR